MLAGLAGLALAGALLRLGVFVLVAQCSRRRWRRGCAWCRSTSTIGSSSSRSSSRARPPILFALLPALQATRLTLTDALRGQVSGGVQSSTLRRILVTSQVAVSLLLLIVATTLVRNGTAIQATDLGLETAA